MVRSDARTSGLLAAYAEAAGSGRFFTLWSALASFIVAVFLLIPVVREGGAEGYLHGAIAAAFAWVILAVPVLLVAAAERRLTERSHRGILVTATLLALGVARPFVNEAALRGLFAQYSDGDTITRVATNLVVIVLLFSLVAIITTQAQRSRRIAERLAVALGRLDRAAAQLASDQPAAVGVVHGVVTDLRASRDRLLESAPDFASVREYSELVRAASHRLEELAAAPVSYPAGGPRELDPATRPGIHLEPTPLLWVGVAYVIVCLPFVLSTGDVLTLVVAGLSILLLDLAVGGLLRALTGLPMHLRSVAFVAAWIVAGLIAVVIGVALLPEVGLLVFVPLGGLPLCAIVMALAIDSRRRARDQEIASTAALARATHDLADRAAWARRPLSHAAAALHGRVQGRCVLFAALADEATPTPDDVERFRTETDKAFDDVLDPDAGAEPQRVGALSRVLSGWEALMELDTRIDDDVLALAEESTSAPLIADIVNEALVNAVKHSGARAARIRISGDDGAVRVHVVSPGELPRAVMTTRSAVGDTVLYQRGGDVVFESTIASPLVRAHA